MPVHCTFSQTENYKKLFINAYIHMYIHNYTSMYDMIVS